MTPGEGTWGGDLEAAPHPSPAGERMKRLGLGSSLRTGPRVLRKQLEGEVPRPGCAGQGARKALRTPWGA